MLKVKNDLAEMFSNLVDTDSIVLICGTDYAAGDLIRTMALAEI